MFCKEKKIDWGKIEQEYRLGEKTNLAIARDHNVSEGAIRKRAKKEGWVRDLSVRIKIKSDQLVRAAEVREEVRKGRTENDRLIIEANAKAISEIRLSHRSDISRARAHSMRLLEELEILTEKKEILKNLGEIMREEDERGRDKKNDLYNHVISLNSRILNTKQLSEAMRHLIGLEREAFNITDIEPEQKISINVIGGLPDLPR